MKWGAESGGLYIIKSRERERGGEEREIKEHEEFVAFVKK